jgi:8-oxo-dGTP pyrophosphatase MutT (NUDIX family)
MSGNAPKVLHVDRLDLHLDATEWHFAGARRAEIDALFAQLKQAQPALFNGRVLLMHDYAIEHGLLRGTFLEADYAPFVAWQRWGCQDAGILDCFGAAAVRTADGAFLLGVMGAHTYNAGQLYFPCGTPDQSDIAEGARVDLDFSIRRELEEETGLVAASLTAEAGYTLVVDGSLICVIKVMHSPLAAEALRAQILETLAQQRQPELSDIRIVRSSADFDPMMRSFAKAFLAHRFAAG